MIAINFEFNIGDKVEIIETHVFGMVCSLWCGDRGLQYEIAYWSDGDRKKEYLFGSEIKSSGKHKKEMGF